MLGSRWLPGIIATRAAATAGSRMQGSASAVSPASDSRSPRALPLPVVAAAVLPTRPEPGRNPRQPYGAACSARGAPAHGVLPPTCAGLSVSRLRVFRSRCGFLFFDSPLTPLPHPPHPSRIAQPRRLLSAPPGRLRFAMFDRLRENFRDKSWGYLLLGGYDYVRWLSWVRLIAGSRAPHGRARPQRTRRAWGGVGTWGEVDSGRKTWVAKWPRRDDWAPRDDGGACVSFRFVPCCRAVALVWWTLRRLRAVRAPDSGVTACARVLDPSRSEGRRGSASAAGGEGEEG